MFEIKIKYDIFPGRTGHTIYIDSCFVMLYLAPWTLRGMPTSYSFAPPWGASTVVGYLALQPGYCHLCSEVV